MDKPLETGRHSPLPKSLEVTTEESPKDGKLLLSDQFLNPEGTVKDVSRTSEVAVNDGVKTCLEDCIKKCLSDSKRQPEILAAITQTVIKEEKKSSEGADSAEDQVMEQDELEEKEEMKKSFDEREVNQKKYEENVIKQEEFVQKLEENVDNSEIPKERNKRQKSDENNPDNIQNKDTNIETDERETAEQQLKTNIEEDVKKFESLTSETNVKNLNETDQSSNEASTMDDDQLSNEATNVESDQNSNDSANVEEDQTLNEQAKNECHTTDEKISANDDKDSESKTSKEDIVEKEKLESVESSLKTENSQGSDQSKPENKNGERKRSSCRTSLRKEMSQIGHVARQIGAHEVIEYQWPPNSEHHYFLQEQISDYLEVVSFRRRYPELTRRNIEPNERNYLLDRGLVNETQSDLGLVPLRSEEVMELMERDYPEKCKEIAKVLRERERKKMIETVKTTYSTHKSIDKHKLEHLRKKAIKGASEFNSNLRRERKDERRVYFDLQTMQVHFPQRKLKLKEPSFSNPYPAALIPGQFTNYFKKYNPVQLKCLPLNCALRLPPTPPPEQEAHFSEISSSSASEDESQSSEASSEDESNNEPEEVVEKPQPTTPVNRPARLPVSGRARRKRRGAFLFSLPRKLPPKPVGRPPGSTRGRGRGRGRRGRPPLRNVGREIPPLKLNLSAISKTSPESSSAKEQDENQTEPVCGICKGDEGKNKEGSPEDLIRCSDCGRSGHPTCFDITHMLKHIKKYEWQCMECKACALCESTRDEDKMIFCDQCDRGYHTFCLGLTNIPSGNWQCPKCTPKRKTSDDSNDSEVEILPTKKRKIVLKNTNGYNEESSSEADSN